MASAVISWIWGSVICSIWMKVSSRLLACRKPGWDCCTINAISTSAPGRRDGRRWRRCPFLTKGMYYRESIEISFKAKGLTPRYVFESDSTFQIIRAVQAGICCAIMPLNNGLEALSDNLEILPIAETHVDSQLALIMRQQEPVSTPAEKCFAEAQGIFG